MFALLEAYSLLILIYLPCRRQSVWVTSKILTCLSCQKVYQTHWLWVKHAYRATWIELVGFNPNLRYANKFNLFNTYTVEFFYSI